MQNDFAVSLYDMSKEPAYGDLYTYGLLIDKARTFACEYLQTDGVVSAFLDGESAIDDKIKLALNDGDLKIVGKFYESFVNYEVNSDSRILKMDYPTYPNQDIVHDESMSSNKSNSIMYSKHYEVVVVSCYLFKMPYHASVIQIAFARRKIDIIRFRESLNDRYSDMLLGKVLIMTDTHDGMMVNTMKRDDTVQMDSVVLEDDFKSEIVDSINSFFDGKDDFYAKYNIPYRRGVLLYGPPGNGKTTLVKSLVNMIKHPVVYWQINEFTSSYSISEVFRRVSEKAPALLVIEDIDSLPSNLRSMFLNQLDGIQDNAGLFVIGTTNFPEKIDPALMNRAGRFDRAFEVPKPTQEQRYTYLINKGLGGIVDDDTVKLTAELTDDMSMSMLNEVYTQVAMADHTGKEIDVRRIVELLRYTNDKQRKQDWFNDGDSKLGFLG